MVEQLGSPAGRVELSADLRIATADTVRGLPERDEIVLGGDVGAGAGNYPSIGNTVPLTGVRNPPPADSGGASVPQAAGTGPCAAPNGVGTVPVPADTRAGALLTPGHDVFTKSSTGSAVGQDGLISPTGQDPEAGGGPGIELRRVGLIVKPHQQMKVRIHLQDPKGFGPRALYPLIKIRPVGGTAADEFRATIANGAVHCYAGDTDPRRGYFEGWITIPRSEPGFQVIVEVVENDWYFANGGIFVNPNFDAFLAPTGPQYFAGADRATIHVGAPAVTSAQPIPASVGAFATSEPEPPTGVPNALTDTNGEPSDDVEAAIKRYLFRTINDKVASALAGNILQLYALTLQGTPTSTVRSTADLRYTDPADGFGPDTGEPAGATGAIRADVTAGVDVRLFAQVLGVPCNSITAKIDTSIAANVWADSGGPDSSLALKFRRSATADADFDMPRLAWLDPTCVLAWFGGNLLAEHFIAGAIEKGVDGALGFTFNTTCLNDGSLFTSGGTLRDPDAPVPDRCLIPGALQKLLSGFDLNSYLPTVALGGATIKPVVTNLDNAWCRATNPPPGCTPDQNLLGRGGVEVTADAAMVGSLDDALGGDLTGRFRNVFAPTIRGSIEDLVTSHRDLDGAMAGLGVVVDPRQVNMILRHLSQGSGTDRTTAGLLDVPSVTLGDWSLSVRPEVAPMLLGVPAPPIVVSPGGTPGAVQMPGRPMAPVVVPDLRLNLSTSRQSPPIEYSIAASVNAGVGFDRSKGTLSADLDSPAVDIQVIGGCQVDYTRAYAFSYALCGRGTGGTGGPTSLSDLLNYLANELVLPMLTNSIGGISLPDLDGLVPGLSVALTNVRSAQRGGHVAVYADLRPIPQMGIAISQDRFFQPPSLQFFPSQVDNIDLTHETHFAWEIRDGATNQIVASSLIPLTDDDAVRVPFDSFTVAQTNLGLERTAKAKLTLTQPNTGLNITAEGSYHWGQPVPPPPTPCPAGIALLAAPGGGGTPVPC